MRSANFAHAGIAAGLCLAVLPVRTHAQTDLPATDPAAATVTVTAKKEAVVKKLDKTVYNVADTPRAANGSAQDVLQATPELSVSADGAIAVKGNRQVTVLVDGKPTALLSGSADERAVALQTMSGADIASVEVITNPSAAYDAKGGAIVNIVLKRNRKSGAHGQLQASAADHGLWNGGASGDATRGAFSVHASAALRHDGTEKIRASDVAWTNPLAGTSGRTRQTSDVFIHRTVTRAGLGIDVALSDVDSLSVSTNYAARRSRPLFDVLNENSTGLDATTFHRISEGPNEQADRSASVAYSHQDHGAALKAMVQHSDTAALVDKSYQDLYLAPLLPADFSHGATRTARHLDQATLDWTRAREINTVGVGVDIQRKVDAIDNYQAAIDLANGAEMPDAATTNGYRVGTTTSAAYVTDQIRRGKWEALLGARAERSTVGVQATTPAAMPAAHSQAFNPSLHLRYAASDILDVTLNYRRSLQLPDPRDLNPATTYIDAQNLSRGNPNLAPQHVRAWELGANLDRPHLTGGVGAFYRTSSDTVTDARSFDGSVLVTSKQNGGTARSAGVTASLDWTPATPLHLGADAGAYAVQLATPDLLDIVRQHGASAYLNLRAAYSAGADDVALDAHAQSAGITPLGRYGATSSVNLGWKHALTKTLSLTVNANDLFDGSRRTYSTAAATFRQNGFDHFVARRLYVGFVKKID